LAKSCIAGLLKIGARLLPTSPSLSLALNPGFARFPIMSFAARRACERQGDIEGQALENHGFGIQAGRDWLPGLTAKDQDNWHRQCSIRDVTRLPSEETEAGLGQIQ
jgi:hypothetical protein